MAAELAKELGILITIPPRCPNCLRRMHVERVKIRQGLNGRYRCSVGICRSSLSLTHNSIFEDSHVHLDVAFDILYAYVEKKTIKNAAYISGVCESTVKQWFKKFRARIREYIAPIINLHTFYDHFNTYEVDECHIYTHKNHQGRILAGNKYWIVGIFERETKKIKLLITRRRNSSFLSDL